MRAHDYDHDGPVLPRPKAARPHAPDAGAAARAAASGQWSAVSAGGMLGLQRAAGNRGVAAGLQDQDRSAVHYVVGSGGQLLEPGVRAAAAATTQVTSSQRVARALVAGAADDPCEREADAVARAVVRGVGVRPVESSASALPAGCFESSDAVLARRADPDEVIGVEGGPVGRDIETGIASARGRGRKLEEGVQSQMEGALGADLSRVRVHSGSQSAILNRRLGAKAFTAGSDIFFGDSVPDITSPEGVHLLAHELTHTLQQGNAPVQRSVIRRFRIDDRITTNRTSKVTRSASGATGVYFFEDMLGGDPLIAKATDDPAGEANVNQSLLKSAGIETPQMRVAGDVERFWISYTLDQKWQPTDVVLQTQKPQIVQEFVAPAKTVYVMGKVAGKNLGEVARTEPGRLTGLMETPEFMKKLGYLDAIDTFLGVGDRMKIGNIGNVMVTADNEIRAIDNFDLKSAANRFGTAFVLNTGEGGAGVGRLAAGKLEGFARADLKEFTRHFAYENKVLEGWPNKATLNKMLVPFVEGMQEGVQKIIAKLAPRQSSFDKWWSGSKRDRALKRDIEGGGLAQAWENLKARAKYLRSIT